MGRQQVQTKKRDEDEEDLDNEDEDERNDDDEDDEDEPESGKSNADDDSDDEDDEEGDDLDSALANQGSRQSIYIDPWRKKGSITIWIHTKAKRSRVGQHKFFDTVQFTKRNGEEVSYVRFTTFNCHESPDYVSISRDRDDDLRREHKATKCPFCKMLEWVEEGVISGRISPDAEIFRFDDGSGENDPKHLQVLHAAGISGLIGLERAPEKWKKICKRSKVLQKEPWNENCGLKLKHAFQVVDDANPTEVKWALEPPDLFYALKDAINSEKKRNGDDDGDPQKNPYALLWEFDKDEAAKNYGKGNKVFAQPKRKLTNKIRRLIEGPKRNDQQDVIGPGNCIELRAIMENAAVIDMPFDEFFKEAKKAGLMDGATQRRSEERRDKRSSDDDEPKSDPKPKTSSKSNSSSMKNEPTKDEDEPGDTCDICGEAVGEDDIECKSCGTTFDSDSNYEIDGIKCTDCGTVVPLNNPSEDGDDTLHICEKCGTIHRLSPGVRKFYDDHREAHRKGKRCDLKFVWEAKEKPKTKDEPKRGRSGRGKASSDSAKLDKKLNGDGFNF